MKPHERRQQGKYPFYKLAKYNNKFKCWQPIQRSYATYDKAKHTAKKRKGAFKIVIVYETHRKDLVIIG